MKKCSGKRKLMGAGFMDFIKGVGNFFKKSKLISTIGSALGAAGVPYAGTIGSAAGAIGLGRRRRRKRLLGGSRCAYPRTAQLLDINQPRTRIARLRKAF